MKGIVPSLNTPFDLNGALDLISLRRLVNHTVESGCGGMLGLAVAGEHATLTMEEKTKFIEVVTDTNAGRIPFIVSVTAPEAEVSLALAKIAANFNATGVCVQLPAKFSRKKSLEFLQSLARHSMGLLMVQDLDWTGDGLPISDIQFLFERVDQFSWIKIETQNAGPKYSAVQRSTKGALNVCGGWAVTQLMDAMTRGVNAFIPTGLERVYVTILEAFVRGEVKIAAELFERVLPVLNYSNQHVDVSIRFFKQLRKAEGLFDTSFCRSVTSDLAENEKAESRQALETALMLIRDVMNIEPGKA